MAVKQISELEPAVLDDYSEFIVGPDKKTTMTSINSYIVSKADTSLSNATDKIPTSKAVKDAETTNYNLLVNFRNHNVPRATPKDITAYKNNGTLWQRINGTNGFSLFEDIFVGDYFEMSRAITLTGTGTTSDAGTKWVTVAGIDSLLSNGDTEGVGYVTYHHLVMVPGKGFRTTDKNNFGRARMNPTNTTVGGYKASEMNTTFIGSVVSSGSTASNATINQQLYAEFSTHLKTTRELVSNSLNASGYNKFGSASGCSNNWEWINAQAICMSEVEVYGSTVWSSSGYDTGNACKQLPLFFYEKYAMNNRSSYYWLKDVASSLYFCRVYSYGGALSSYASYADYYVRPRFVIA